MRSSRVKFSATLERSDGPQDLDLLVDITPPDPGNISGPPDSWYPPEAGEIEIINAYDTSNGEEVTDFSDDEIQKIQELAEQHQAKQVAEPEFELDDDYDY